MCECYLHILFWLADHNLFGQPDPFPLFDHKHRCSPVMCQFSITLHTLHKMTIHSQPLETLLSNLQMTAILNLLFALSDINTYFSEVNWFTEWCTDNFLELSTQKTKEVIFDPKSICMHLPVVTSDQTIEQVGSYKYLGIHIDSKLSWSVLVEAVCSRAQKCLNFLQRLRAFGVSTNILLLFYHATIESMIRYGITSFYGNLSVKSKSQLLHITGTFSKIHSRKSLNRP